MSAVTFKLCVAQPSFADDHAAAGRGDSAAVSAAEKFDLLPGCRFFQDLPVVAEEVISFQHIGITLLKSGDKMGDDLCFTAGEFTIPMAVVSAADFFNGSVIGFDLELHPAQLVKAHAAEKTDPGVDHCRTALVSDIANSSIFRQIGTGDTVTQGKIPCQLFRSLKVFLCDEPRCKGAFLAPVTFPFVEIETHFFCICFKGNDSGERIHKTVLLLNCVKDHHGISRDILMESTGNGFDFCDFIHHIHAFDHLAENAVAVPLRGRAAEVQEIVVHQIDKELAGGGVNDLGTGVGEGAPHIGQLVGGFVFDGGVGFFLVEIFVHAAALDHESVNDPVEEGIFVEAGSHIFQKVFASDGGFFCVEFDFDIAEVGFESDHFCLLLFYFFSVKGKFSISSRGRSIPAEPKLPFSFHALIMARRRELSAG